MNKIEEIKQTMPLLFEAQGVWEGIYRYYDAATGKLTDEHASRLICRLPDDAKPSDYYQTNQYFWTDGRKDVREFPANYHDGRIWWDNDLIKGWAAEMRPDDLGLSTCLNWERKGEPGMYLYEMIQVDKPHNFRSRTWHWFRDGKCFQRTLIDEHRVSHDWKNWTNNEMPEVGL